MNALKTAREAQRLSAATLAEIANTRETRIYAFERLRQRPYATEAARIAAALGEPVEILFPMGTQTRPEL